MSFEDFVFNKIFGGRLPARMKHYAIRIDFDGSLYLYREKTLGKYVCLRKYIGQGGEA